ncbi:MAG: arginase family protein [Sphingomonadaceae bacterium]
MTGWTPISDLLTSDEDAAIALIGAPLEAGSVTPGRCDLAPGMVRKTLARLSRYDVESGSELSAPVHDAGDAPVHGLPPSEAFAPLRDAVQTQAERRALTLVLGGNNAVTRPAAHALGRPLEEIGLITLDAHFDMRDTKDGLSNGNPVRALLEDGLPGRNICQIGLAPFANTARMHRDAEEAGIGIFPIADVRARGIGAVVEEALARLGHVGRLMVDFDIDVIDRGQCPGAPGARPGGMAAEDFFAAARMLAAFPQVRLVDLTEYDPPLDLGETSALTAARWVAEILAGFERR